MYMKKIVYLVFSLFALSLISCGQKKTETGDGKVIYDTIPVTNIKITPEYYFAGGFSYMADAAVLNEFVTGQNIPVAMEGLYLNAEKQYSGLKLSPGKSVNTAFRGYLKQKAKDEEGPEEQLVITQIISMNPETVSSSVKVLTGEYFAPDQSLNINSDHTYELKSKSGKSEQGKWFLIADNMIVFNSENGRTIMNVDFLGKKISTRDDSPVIFEKK